MALDVTVGGVSANSYCSLAEAEAYHLTRLHVEDWVGADAVKETALRWATRLLDEQVRWTGQAASSTQALRWPRVDVVTPEGFLQSSTVLPAWLKNATAELARALLAADRTVDPETGITRVKADVVEADFGETIFADMLPASVISMVQQYGTIIGTSSGGISEAKLVRV